MQWFLVNNVITLLVAAAVFVTGDWLRGRDVPAPGRPGLTAVLAGVVWPVTVLGVLQLVLVVTAGRAMSRSRLSGAPLAAATGV